MFFCFSNFFCFSFCFSFVFVLILYFVYDVDSNNNRHVLFLLTARCNAICIAQTMLLQHVRPSVRPSVTRQYSIEKATHIIKLSSPTRSHPILVFPHQTVWQYSDGDPTNKGIEFTGYEEIAMFGQCIALSRKRYQLYHVRL